ncbi:hypothetical protein GNI_093180 [Gregarina niphandrodes]|uniref:GP-PDE domain-containing protein n=1 Tax=Gregarina niphandrodes TaxID=110365 RepID=A0A023B578_GRENI|nr:hypothetical protein GNI_093180 [Gregarina niphandrodes]EZG59049.1 hypothetical protein GNI_093180 [Gregarina niphandrodes]|eukprot:XP_011130915.1 hypothetical protein GNI_093180 [Gregarina niphandrodes]
MNQDGETLVSSSKKYKSSAILDWYIPDYPWRVIKRVSAACSTLNPECNSVPRESLARVRDLIKLAFKYSTVDKPVGLYLEIKHQMWHASRRDIDLIYELLVLLEEYGGDDLEFPFPIYLQTFEYPDLVRLRKRVGFYTNICLVALLDETSHVTHDHVLRKLPPADFIEVIGPTEAEVTGPIEVEVTAIEKVGAVAAGTRIHEDTVGRETAGRKTVGRETVGRETVGRINGLEMMSAVWVRLSGNCEEICSEDCLGMGYMSTVVASARRITDQEWYEKCPSELQQIESRIFYSCADEHVCSAHAVTDDLDTCSAEMPCVNREQHLSSFWTTNDRHVDITCIADILGPDLNLLRAHPDLAEEISNRNIQLHAWTINDRQTLEDSVAMGCQGVFTDDYEMAYNHFHQ